jgi:hypothetical protein
MLPAFDQLISCTKEVIIRTSGFLGLLLNAEQISNWNISWRRPFALVLSPPSPAHCVDPAACVAQQRHPCASALAYRELQQRDCLLQLSASFAEKATGKVAF